MRKVVNTLPDLSESEHISELYFNVIQFFNNVLVGTVGITLGLFKIENLSLKGHELLMLELLVLSLFFGILALMYSITPKIQKIKNEDFVTVPIITRRLIFGMTFLQIIFALTGYLEAILSILKSP